MAISVQTVVEVQYGLASVRSRDGALAATSPSWLEQVIAIMSVLDFDVQAPRVVGETRAIDAIAALEGDFAIAATAISVGASVATLNLRDFRLIARHVPGLTVIDPLAAQ